MIITTRYFFFYNAHILLLDRLKSVIVSVFSI